MKRSAIKRKTPLRANPETTRAFVERNRQPVAKESAAMKVRKREYRKRLAKRNEEERWCARCLTLGKKTPATDNHHEQGREKRRDVDLMLDGPQVDLCRPCHEWCPKHRAEAVALGFIKSRHTSFQLQKEQREEREREECP